MMADVDRAGSYAGYDEWKKWSDLFRFDADAADYFARECAGLEISGAEVLEIGFGAGAFLAWARDRGAHVSGVEMIPALLEAARTSGVRILPEDLEAVAGEHRDRFDTIAAFDVFEHLSLDQISSRLRAVECMLKPGGHLLLRFPNPQSPFGLAPQFGDPTHRTALSLGVFERLIHGTKYEVVRYAGAARAPGRRLATRLVRFARYAIQDLIAFVLGVVYAQAIPWDPVVTLVLRKSLGARPTGASVAERRG